MLKKSHQILGTYICLYGWERAIMLELRECPHVGTANNCLTLLIQTSEWDDSVPRLCFVRSVVQVSCGSCFDYIPLLCLLYLCGLVFLQLCLLVFLVFSSCLVFTLLRFRVLSLLFFLSLTFYVLSVLPPCLEFPSCLISPQVFHLGLESPLCLFAPSPCPRYRSLLVHYSIMLSFVVLV